MTDTGIIEPSDAEVLQTEADEYPSFPVEVVGNVRVQILPPVRSTHTKVTLTDSVPRQILAHDPRRASTTIVPSLPIRFAVRQGQCDSTSAPEWDMALARAPLVLHSDEELWVAPVTPLVAPAVLTLTVITENWTN